MKRASRIWITSICAISCLLGAMHWLHTMPVHAQQQTGVYDDGTFYITAFVDVDSNYTLYVASYMLVEFDDFEDIDEIEVDGYADEDDENIASDYSVGDDYDPAAFALQSNAPVATGHEYGMESDGLACFDDGEGDEDCEYVGVAYASINVAALTPQIASITPSSVNQGDQGTLTITGSNLVENSGDQLTINFSGGGNPFTLTGTPSSSTASFSYNFSGIAAGTYNLSVTNNEGTSNSETFTVLSVQALNACAVTSNPHAGYTSIAATGTPGGSGTMAVSFSGTAFAAISQSVPYGPSSTPNSIAAHIAALITQHYFQYGLTAKAFGPNIVYSGDSTIGAVSNTASGSSFTTTTSSTAASGAEIACGSAPPDSNSYTLTPSRLNLSTGDTNKSITIYASQGNSMSGIAYSSSLTSNTASNCQASLSFASPQSSSTAVAATSTGCSGASGVFSVNAAVNATSTNYISVVVPPQQLIQVLYGEANIAVGGSGAATAKILMEALANTIGNRYLSPLFSPNTSWQAIITAPNQFDGYNASTQQIAGGVEPELDAASDVFARSSPIASVGSAECFFSPDSDGWTAIQQAQTNNATTVPTVNYTPKCYSTSTKQFIIKSSAGTRSGGRPWFIFVQQKQPTDPAIITIP